MGTSNCLQSKVINDSLIIIHNPYKIRFENNVKSARTGYISNKNEICLDDDLIGITRLIKMSENILYLESLGIFQTINLLRENPLILVEKIDELLKNSEEYEIIVNEKEGIFQISKNVIKEIKQFLMKQSSVDCIMLEESLYHVALNNFNLFLQNNSNISRKSIIDKITREYSDSEVNLTEFILHTNRYLSPINLILLLMENVNNREKIFNENYQYGTVVCGPYNEKLQVTIILLIN